MGVDREAERAEARLDRAVEDRLDPGMVAAYVELENLQAAPAPPSRFPPVRASTPSSGTSGSRMCRRRWRRRRRRRIEPLDAADRRQRHRHRELALEEVGAGVGVVDVAQDARAERQRVDGQAVSAHRGLGLRAADQIVPDVAIELGAGGGTISCRFWNFSRT